MSNESTAPTNEFGKVQSGPPYRCFECGAASGKLIQCNHSGHLAAWSESIAYLTLPPACRNSGHPARVAILDGAITSLTFPYDDDVTSATTEECVALIREALICIAMGALAP